MTAINVSEYR